MKRNVARQLFRTAPWLAAAFLVLGVASSILLHHELREVQRAGFERYVSNLSSYIESDLLSDLTDQVNAQFRMAARVRDSSAASEAAWQSNADLYLQHYPYYRSLAIVDPDFQIRWIRSSDVFPLQRQQTYPLSDEYRQRLQESAQTGELVLTQPFLLHDERSGINFITPVGTGNNHRGFLAAVLVIPEAIDAMVPTLFRDEIILNAVSRDRNVYPFPAHHLDLSSGWDAAFELDLDGDGAGMLFRFRLTEAARAQHQTILPLMVLVAGILLSILLAAVTLLARNAGRQAKVLARSNRQLEEQVREREQAERKLEFLVSHDSLTNLPNRTGTTASIAVMIADHKPKSGQLAVLFLDLDQFKDINDSLGHQLGDQLLCEIPSRLAGVLRDQDFIGRHGGDEFIIAVHRDNREQVQQLAANILRALERGFAIEDHRLFISASIGIALYPESGRTVSELIQNADTALFKAKHAGRNQFAIFTREMFAKTQHRLNLSRDIRHALDRKDFRVVYQPIVDLRDLSLCGVEALLRWQHEKGYMVPPQEFIRIAEETGIIGRMGQYVLDHALADLAEWKKNCSTPPWLAVNISGAQVHEASFAEQLSVLLHRYRIEPELLHLEITEEVLIENLARNRTMLRKLDEIGMRIVVDDFGVGYSSLAYLKNFPISIVKIDRGFIRDLPSDPEDQAITRTICSLSRDLGMQTIAEGVENAEQLERLREYQCLFAQGYLFSRPVGAEVIAQFIAGKRPWLQSAEKDVAVK